MRRTSILLVLATAAAAAVMVGVQAASSDNSSQTITPAQIQGFAAQAPKLAGSAPAAPASDPPPAGHLQVIPSQYDPGKTNLVQGAWVGATGCPTGTDACTSGDPQDKKNDGLLLVKTGPTSTNAAALADVNGVKGVPLTELGYDIRKAAGIGSPNGSHCGAGAPRFNVQTTDGFWFVGCASPPPTSETPGAAWGRLRWGDGTAGSVVGYNASTGVLGPITGNVQSIQIVFDEGTDTGPDFSGAAVLDNVDVNGNIAGTGPGNPQP